MTVVAVRSTKELSAIRWSCTNTLPNPASQISMRPLPLFLSAILLVVARNVLYASEIREFPIPILERLGNELSRRDSIAARGTDAVLQTQPAARAMKMRGWITELGKDEDKVHLIAQTSSGFVLAYTVTFHGTENPEVQDRRGQALPPNIAVRLKARNTASAALRGRLFEVIYNFEVLDDPDGSGFLVYALGASTKPDEVVLGGHFRVTVSAGGAKAKRVDALSRTLLIADKKSADPGNPAEAMVMVQLVSANPVETLVYTNKLAGLPIFVATTPGGKIWEIDNGKMKDTGKKVGEKQ